MTRFRVFRMLAASGFLLVNDGPVHGTVHAQGLGIGFGAGALIGIATTLPSDACDRNEPYMPMTVGCSGATVVVAAALGALGGIAGLVAGALVRGERWEPIPVSTPAEPTLPGTSRCPGRIE